jgi:REP element-mobilizing transposase RayT
VNNSASDKPRNEQKPPLQRKLKSPKHPIHLTLKSKKAVGNLSMYHQKEKIEALIRKYAIKYGVEIQDLINMGNHFHIRLTIRRRDLFAQFLRTITAMIARLVTKAKKGNKFGKFWDALAFTRIVKSRIEQLQLRGYFKANRIEQKYGYEAREKYLKAFNQWIYRLKKLKAKTRAQALAQAGPKFARASLKLAKLDGPQ